MGGRLPLGEAGPAAGFPLFGDVWRGARPRPACSSPNRYNIVYVCNVYVCVL